VANNSTQGNGSAFALEIRCSTGLCLRSVLIQDTHKTARTEVNAQNIKCLLTCCSTCSCMLMPVVPMVVTMLPTATANTTTASVAPLIVVVVMSARPTTAAGVAATALAKASTFKVIALPDMLVPVGLGARDNAGKATATAAAAAATAGDRSWTRVVVHVCARGCAPA